MSRKPVKQELFHFTDEETGALLNLTLGSSLPKDINAVLRVKART